jgi:hypothetical protein
MEKVTNLYNEGKISPIDKIEAFDAQNVEDAFRYFQKGQHIGKIVVNMPQNSLELTTSTARKHLSFNPNAAYLLIGGLGGLGRAVSVWMAERGAKHFIYLSRSKGQSSKTTTFLRELTALSCSYQIFQGSVASTADVENAVKNAMKPIHGVLQMAMVLNVISPLPQSTQHI